MTAKRTNQASERRRPREVREDEFDSALAEQRRDQRRESLTDVRRRLPISSRRRRA